MPYRIDRTEIIEAPVDVVYETVADVPSYPEFLEEFESVRVKGDVVEMSVRAGPITLNWTQRVKMEPNKSIRFELLSGPFRSFRGGWEFAPLDAGTRARYWTEFELALRIPGVSGIVERQVERNTERTLAAFQRRVREIMRKRQAKES
jgi:ribosome-associated toxin RatA of RatAB toxin-antitoxin module